MTRVKNYEILKEIGKGGFGRVFEAEHIHLGVKACLKQNMRNDGEDVELLKKEAQLLWKLDDYHSIPSVKDFFLLGKNNAIMVMSHIDGQTLEELVEKKGPLHPEDASWIMERLLGALYYIHHHGVVHSDVKPQNVFVEPKKRDIKLIDFGLASYKPGGMTRPIGYTPAYAAPELVDGKPPIPETDLYGAGMVMIRALGGDISKKSFRADTPKEIQEFCRRLVLYDPRQRPSWDNENLIENLSDIREHVFGRRHSGMPIKLKGGSK